MIVIDGRNIYGINRYQLKRKNGNNEERYLVKYKGIYKRGFKSSIDAYLFIKSVDEGNYTVVNEVPERKPQIDKRRDYSVREAAEKYLEIYKEEVRYGSYDKTHNVMMNIIVPNLPDVPVSSVKNIDLLEFRSRLNKDIRYMTKAKGYVRYSTGTKNFIVTTLKKFMSFCIANFGAGPNICKDVKHFKETHEEKQKRNEKNENMWSIDEYYSFMAMLSKIYGEYSPTYGVYLVMGNKGLRIGEVLALRYQDLKFENTLIVDESITLKSENATFEVSNPKNDTSIRRIVISHGLYSYLLELKKRDQRYPDFSDKWFIFHRPRKPDIPMAHQTLQKHKENACEQIGLRLNTNHQLRHMYNTFLKDQGIPVFDRSAVLGQKDADINSEIYTHLSDDALKKVAAADEIIFSMKNKKVAQTLQENEKA